MLLDTVDRSLLIYLGEVKITNEMELNAQIEDKIIERVTQQTFLELSNGTTPQVLIPAPAANTARRIVELNLHNHDTITHAVFVEILDGSASYRVYKASLTAGQTLTYNAFNGWTIG